MDILKKYRINKIEKQMLSFITLVECFGRTDDDLISVLDRANQYMGEPLKTIISDFVIDARIYGNIDNSFEMVKERLEGTKLYDIFWELKLCSIYDADYKTVINDARNSVKEYLKSKELTKAMVDSARVDVISLFGAGLLVIRILEQFISGSVWDTLCSSYIGIAIIIYCVVITVICFYEFFRVV